MVRIAWLAVFLILGSASYPALAGSESGVGQVGPTGGAGLSN